MVLANTKSTIGNNVVIKVRMGKVTRKGAKGKTINSSTTSYYSAKPEQNTERTATFVNKSVEDLWFAQDNNSAADNNVESIIDTNQNNYSLGKIDTSSNLTNLTNDKNLLLTYNKDKK